MCSQLVAVMLNVRLSSSCQLSGVDGSRIVPEYSFLDARGLGAFEGRALAAYQEVNRHFPSNWSALEHRQAVCNRKSSMLNSSTARMCVCNAGL